MGYSNGGVCDYFQPMLSKFWCRVAGGGRKRSFFERIWAERNMSKYISIKIVCWIWEGAVVCLYVSVRVTKNEVLFDLIFYSGLPTFSSLHNFVLHENFNYLVFRWKKKPPPVLWFSILYCARIYRHHL